MPKHCRHLLLSLYLLLFGWNGVFNFPYNTELLLDGQDMAYATTECNDHVLITLQEQNTKLAETNDNKTAAELALLMDGGDDDLIFAVKKPQQLPNEVFHQIDLLTSAEEDSFAATLSTARTYSFASAESELVPSAPHQIELERSADHISDISTVGRSTPLSLIQPPPIDMSDFLALIPVTQVKSIVANYYRNDAEVQRAYAFLRSHDFTALKEHIIAVPEMSAFLTYLNNLGLNVLEFLNQLCSLFDTALADAGKEDALTVKGPQQSGNGRTTDNPFAHVDEPSEGHSTLSPLKTTTIESEQLHGLHGLVDSILDVMPQDQILATFFDKLETDEQFAKLVENVPSANFAKILANLQNSVPLRNLIFSLHNNGIYIIKIVDSLKSYFFLSAF